MKSIEIDDDLYAFIASQTKHIGESASQILRRLLLPEDGAVSNNSSVAATKTSEIKNAAAKIAEAEMDTVSDKTRESVKTTAKTDSRTPTQEKAAPKVNAKKAGAKTPAGKVVSKPVRNAEPSATAEQHNKRDIIDAVSKDALSTFTKRVDQFLFVLSAAHKLNADDFEAVQSIKGKNRTYFATSKEALLENGSSTNPKAIPDSPFWVVTNNNTAKKTAMLEQVLRILGYKDDVIETVITRFSAEGK